MGKNSAIEWTDHTFNPWIGCTKVSAGCANCYAEAMMDKRLGRVQWGVNGTRERTSAANWRQPIKWDREAAEAGARRRVFCASLADVFEDRPELVAWRADLFALIVTTPHLDWLLLTKRPENVIDMALGQAPNAKIPDNVWLGVSVENQEQADRRIPLLLLIPARVRFLSMEPMLGPVDLVEAGALWTSVQDNSIVKTTPAWRLINWVIVGGESGHNARPMHPDWSRSIRDQCQAAGVPFFFKRWGQYSPASVFDDTTMAGGRAFYHNGKWAAMPGNRRGYVWLDDNTVGVRTGKKAAGRLLDGREWSEFPE